MRKIPKPQPGEYAPYTVMYIGLLLDDQLVLQHLSDNFQTMKDFIYALPEDILTVPWQADEWTVQEILGHVMDVERVFCYRALRFARNDSTELPGFEQNDYVPFSGANGRSLDTIFAEYESVRRATITLFNSFDDEALMRSGVASGQRMSVRAAAYIIAGHELHHLYSIRENYF